ncbi:MAG: PAS domain S-box protein [Bacteroidales bacterium]|jgi:PAS domain S-box-containing protein|nr:PAS domain S-box protein [Bacteroidales bacterium]
MKEKNSQSVVFKYTISGFIIGLLTVLFILTVDFFVKKVSFSEVLEIHKSNPVYLILDLSPFVLAFYAYLISRKYADTKQSLHSALKQELDKNQRIFRFVEKIRMGNINAEYKVQGEDDVLGQSILDLRDNLKKNKEEEDRRRKEDHQRNWVAEGLAKFGDILRKDTDNLEELSYNLISKLVKYIDANQGAFFIIEDEDQADVHVRMTACYAYERRKYADKRIELNEGIIGAAILEQETIYMTDVPESYVNITSGLGKSTPGCLLVVPLKINDEVHGVIEIGAIKPIDKHIVEFVEKVAENIGSTISNVKINSRTAKLLKESRQQAEALAAQEEQMRQNMEELQATQEEAARQSEKFITFTNAVNHTLLRAEYDPDGTLIYANTKFLKKLGYEKNSEVEGQNISLFINEKDRSWFNDLWRKLANGGKHFEGDMKHVTKQGRDLWTISTYTCMRREDGSVEKILFLAIDTTDQKKKSMDYQAQIDALNKSTIKVEFLPTGDLLECNKLFIDLMDYPLYELKEKSIFDFVDKSDLNKIKEIWNKVSQGESWEGTLRQRTKEDKDVWIRVSLSAVRDMYQDISKVIYIGNDITNEKLMEIETQKQTELLKQQEEELKQSRVDLKLQLKKAREEVKQQFKEIEKVQKRTERTLEGASDAIVTFDQHGVIKFFNNAAEQLWEIERDIVVGRKINKLFPGENYEDEFIISLLDPKADKMVGERKEVTIESTTGEEKSVIILLSMARLEDEVSYTAFIQNISVDLF